MSKKNILITKKKLLSLLETNIKEMAIDYGNRPERINPDIENKLANKEHPYKDNPAIPQEVPQGIPSNFEELISSQRFKDVVEKVKYYTGVQANITQENTFIQLQRMMLAAMQHVLQFEQQYKQELEQLAVDLVKKEMSIPEGFVQFDAKLVGIGEISEEGFSNQEQNPTEEEIEQEFGINGDDAEQDVEQFMSAFENFDEEVAKRRMLNALIQGSAKKGHYMFELVNERLTQMDPNIIKLYGVLMSVNDLLYWIFPDEMILGGGGGGDAKAGKEELNIQTEPPTIIARGVFFPALVHELIKGVMELIASKGLPKEQRAADMVMGVTDNIPSEIWDLRLGPIIWSKFVESYPDRLFDDDVKHIQNYLFSRFSQLSTKEFFRVTKLILKGDPLGKQIIERMVSEIEEHLRNEDWEEEEYNMGNTDDEGGLDDFLGSLGISLSPDEE
jgi:hypothetical protein